MLSVVVCGCGQTATRVGSPSWKDMASPRKTSERPSNVTELRARIDAGRTGDKVPGGDPAAAPLGTDEEAAGTPAKPAEIATALEDETRQGRARPAPGFTPAPQDSIAPDADPRRPRGNFWIALIVAVIAIAIVYLIWTVRR
jgi:hypothetical protein